MFVRLIYFANAFDSSIHAGFCKDEQDFDCSSNLCEETSVAAIAKFDVDVLYLVFAIIFL